MTKEDLFKKYTIDETHNIWNEQIDNWMSIEIYRIMHDGNLPMENDLTVLWIPAFLDRIHRFDKEIIKRTDFGNLYLTAKRMIYKFSDQILNENK